MKKLSLALVGALLASSCSLVEPVPDSDQVILSNDLERCHKLEETEFSVLSTVLFMARDKPIIADELRTLAQNRAIEIGGNAIWAVSGVNEGKQTFSILRCPPNR